MWCREYNWKEIKDLMQNCENVIQEWKVDTFFKLHFHNFALNLGSAVISKNQKYL